MKKAGQGKNDEGSGFFVLSHLWMRGYFMLGQVKQGLMSAPQGQKISPAGLEPPAGARNRRKPTMKMRRNRLHPNILKTRSDKFNCIEPLNFRAE